MLLQSSTEPHRSERTAPLKQSRPLRIARVGQRNSAEKRIGSRAKDLVRTKARGRPSGKSVARRSGMNPYRERHRGSQSTVKTDRAKISMAHRWLSRSVWEMMMSEVLPRLGERSFLLPINKSSENGTRTGVRPSFFRYINRSRLTSKRAEEKVEKNGLRRLAPLTSSERGRSLS